MQALRQYLLSVTGAALICGVLSRLLPEKGTARAVGRLLMGIFMALTVVGPWVHVRLDQLDSLTWQYRLQASQAVAQGLEQTKNALADSIKAQTQAYILDKARELGLELTVEVMVSDESLPTPVSVRLQGSAGPYARGRLERILTQELGIAKEQQIWI